jgi:7-cyano-7-deazaguanine reductase
MIYDNRFIDPLEKKAQKTTGILRKPGDIDVSILQTIDYEYFYRKILVTMSSDEFTCVCPFSGLPDFAKLTIVYTPRKKLIEMKSLKYYLYSYRNVKIYNEHVANKILEDLVNLLKPWSMEILAVFTSRGGMCNTISACYSSKK